MPPMKELSASTTARNGLVIHLRRYPTDTDPQENVDPIDRIRGQKPRVAPAHNKGSRAGGFAFAGTRFSFALRTES
jgi:hypothetical protein